MRSKALLGLVLFGLGTAIPTTSRADERIIPPAVTKVWPVGMQRGTTVSVSLDGRNLSGIKAIIFDSPGISAKPLQNTDTEEEKPVIRPGLVDTNAPVPRGKRQTATIEVTAAQEVAPGLHWFRVQTAMGISNMKPFDVGAFPEVDSHIKTGARAEMQLEPAKLPATLVGTIAAPGEVDSYEFDGRTGEELVFRVTAARLGSRLESLLVLRNESGQVLAEAGRNENRADAVLTYKLPQAGKYTLGVTDREKGGSEDHYYRVDAGPLPYITQVFPLGVRAGEPATVSITGVNLGDLREVKVDPPKSTDGGTMMPLNINARSLNTVKLAVGNDPEIVEQEPNDSPAQAQTVSLPVTINGHISGATKDSGSADEDYFRFHAGKGEKLSIEVVAARLGSPLDSVIEVLDTQGNPIPRATLRCLNETVTTLSDRDSRTPGIRLTSTSGFHEKDYLMVGDELDQLVYIADQPDEDVRMRSAGGLRWALMGTSPDVHAVNTPVYRVEILPPVAEFPPNGLPVFHLTWRNDDGGPGYGSDSRLNFVAPQDGDYILHLKDVRGLQGQNFAYRLSIHDASPDYQLTFAPENPNIPKGGTAFISVDANRVKGYDGPIEIDVEGLPAGVTAGIATIPAGQDSTLILLSADASASVDAMPTVFKVVGHAKVNGHELTRVANEDAPLDLASVMPPPDAIVTAGPSRVTLEPGQEVKVTLHVERRNGFQGRVPCKVRNLPPGVRVVNVGLNGVLVTETQTSRTFTLHAEDWAKPITQPIYVVAEVESNSPTMHPSPPLIVEVVGNKETANAIPNKEGNGHEGDKDTRSPNR
jgi:hypothetical protein